MQQFNDNDLRAELKAAMPSVRWTIHRHRGIAPRITGVMIVERRRAFTVKGHFHVGFKEWAVEMFDGMPQGISPLLTARGRSLDVALRRLVYSAQSLKDRASSAEEWLLETLAPSTEE